MSLMPNCPPKYKVEVLAYGGANNLRSCSCSCDDSGKWAGNAMRYDTREEAEAAARDLFSRWMLVREWRVVEVDPWAEEYERKAKSNAQEDC